MAIKITSFLKLRLLQKLLQISQNLHLSSLHIHQVTHINRLNRIRVHRNKETTYRKSYKRHHK